MTDRSNVRTVFARFYSIYKENADVKDHVKVCDAFLAFLKLFKYEELIDMDVAQLKVLVTRATADVQVEESPTLKLEPGDTSDKKKSLIGALRGEGRT